MTRECTTDSSQQMEQGGGLSGTGPNEARSRIAAAAGAALVGAVLCGFFYRTVFLGRPVAKLDLLRSIDALYNNALTQSIVPIPCDPSGVLIFYPLGNFVHQCWSRAVVPLWNPLVGCGYPMAGDPQSFIFSVAHVFGVFANPQTYNAGLMAEIVLGAAGVYVFARSFRLSAVACVLAALSFSLSCRNLAQVDLSGSECFFPWLFVVFGWMARKPGLMRVFVCGTSVALTAFAAHPEPAFFAAMYAAIFACCALLFPAGTASAMTDDELGQDRDPAAKLSGEASAVEAGNLGAGSDRESETTGKIGTRKSGGELRNPLYQGAGAASVHKSGGATTAPAIGLTRVSCILLATAAIAVCLSAPLIIPFVEFMHNAYFYKDAAAGASFVPVDRFLSSFCAATDQECYFPGAVALLLLPAGFLGGRLARSVLITTILCALITVPAGFLVPLLSMKPLSYVATLYGIPELLLLLSVVSACGMDTLLRAMNLRRFMLLAASAIGVAAGPYLVSYFAAGTDDSVLIQRSISEHHQLISAISWIVIGSFLILSVKYLVDFWRARKGVTKEPGSSRAPQAPAGKLASVMAVLLVSLNFVSSALIARHALPARKSMDFDCPTILRGAVSDGERVVATGSNLFLPNTGCIYNVSDLRCFSPLLPARYKRYVTECGATSHNLYFMSFADSMPHNIDLAAVKRVITRTAICSLDDMSAPQRQRMQLEYRNSGTEPSSGSATFSLPLCRGVRLCGATLSEDLLNRQIDGQLELTVQGQAVNRYALQFVVFDHDTGKQRWSAPCRIFGGDPYLINSVVEPVHVPLPAAEPARFDLGLKIVDSWTGQSLTDDIASFPKRGGALILSSTNCSNRPANAVGARHFKLLRDDGGMRVYDNTRAVPAAYVIAQARVFNTGSEQQSFDFLRSVPDARSSACLEKPMQPGEHTTASARVDSRGSGEIAPMVRGESKGVPAETKGVSGVSRGVPAESKGVSGESKGVPAESKGVSGESKGVPVETKGVSGESKGVLAETKGVPGESSKVPGSANADAEVRWENCSAHDASLVESHAARQEGTLLEDSPALLSAARRSGAGERSLDAAVKPALVERPDCNTVVVRADCVVPSVLVLTDLYYPGWQCTVDGVLSPIYPANYLFRGVELSPGSHTVRFSYSPASFAIGVVVSFVCLFSCLLSAVFLRKRFKS